MTDLPVTPIPSAARPHATPTLDRDIRLRDAAERLEASFLSEMLKSAGLGEARDSFGGGAGEEHFASFLRDRQALEMARRGGIGLAESLFEAMRARADGQD